MTSIILCQNDFRKDVSQTHIIEKPMAGSGRHSIQPQIDSHREEREQGGDYKGTEQKQACKGGSGGSGRGE